MKKFIRRLKIRFTDKKKYAQMIGVKMGEHTSIASKDHWSSEPYLIEIGDYCRITKGVKFFTHGAARLARRKYPNYDFFGKIKVGDWCFIGTNALIMPGVTIEDNVIVAAGSVVAKSVPKGSIVAGNPARIVGHIDDFIEKNLKYNMNTKGKSRAEKKKILLSQDESMFVKKKFMTE